MPEIAINQVEYNNSPIGPIIHIFGRDKDGKALQINVGGFEPYFYVPTEQIKDETLSYPILRREEMSYPSIRGEDMTRLYTQFPEDIRQVRETYHHHEADIPFATRFMLDMGLTGGVSAETKGVVNFKDLRPAVVDSPARTCIVDIECFDENGFPIPTRDEIICLTCYDSFEDDYITFVLGNESTEEKIALKKPLANGCFSKDKHIICVYHDEISMMKDFSEYIKDRDPDILTGWNFTDFDMPYIIERMNTLGINVDSLARIPGLSPNRIELRGRVLFDLLTAYKKMHLTKKESYRLDAIAMDEVGEQKVRYAGTLGGLWRNNPELLVEYNFKDVELCVKIERKDSIIAFFREIARYVGMPLDKTLNSSNVVDVFVLRKASGQFVLPSRGNAKGEKFEGATVFEPSIGIKENIVVLDLKSLYPMSMMTINASLETKDPAGELVAPNGVRFKKSPDGITRVIISELLKERDDKKALRNKYEFGSPQYVMYDMQQNVLKVIMNTYYGVSGYSRFRLYDREIGDSVTSVGRAIIEHTRKIIEGQGYKVIYGDTDSCMVQLPHMPKDKMIATAKSLEKILNVSYPVFAKEKLNADQNYFSIKFEKIYQRFFQSGKKKRYAGLLTWKEGQDVHEVDVVGFELKRSDTPMVTKVVQMKVMEMILAGIDYEGIRTFLSGVIKKYRAGKYLLDEIGIPGGIGKELDKYEHPDAQVRGCQYSNLYLGTNFTSGSKPKRVYLSTVTAKYPRTDVICFEFSDQVPKEFVVDWGVMLEKTVKGPISRITESLGWDWNQIDPAMTTLAQWGF